MSVHAGNHIGAHIVKKKAVSVAFRIVAVVVSIYGAYAFVKRDISSYLFIKNQFVLESYCQFWVGCTSIRTEHGAYKVNPSAGSYNTKHGQECRTKVTYENKMAAGITYFFGSNKDREDFLHSKVFLIEGFIALKKQDNVFGFLCRVEQKNDSRIFTEGYTNRPPGKSNIGYFVH